MPRRSTVAPADRNETIETRVQQETKIRWGKLYAELKITKKWSHQEEFVQHLLELGEAAARGLSRVDSRSLDS